MENQILDYDQEGYYDPDEFIVGKGKRLLNHIIDRTLHFVLWFFLAFILVDAQGVSNSESPGGLFIVVYFGTFILYYAIFEKVFGQTVGKMITGTKVVTTSGQKPSFRDTLQRAACRLIPFEPFSFFQERAIGWHDSIPNTRVVEKAYPTRN